MCFLVRSCAKFVNYSFKKFKMSSSLRKIKIMLNIDYITCLGLKKTSPTLFSLFWYSFFVLYRSLKMRTSGVLAVAQQVKNPTAGAQVTVKAYEAALRSSAQCSGLKVQHCQSCCSCSSDSVSSLGTSICHECSHKKILFNKK